MACITYVIVQSGLRSIDNVQTPTVCDGNQRWADRYFGPLVRWSAAQRTTEMLADQRTGKNSGPAPADYRNWASASPLLNYLREVI